MQLFIITIWDRAKTLDTALHVEHADGTKFRLPCSISESDPKNKKKTYLPIQSYLHSIEEKIFNNKRKYRKMSVRITNQQHAPKDPHLSLNLAHQNPQMSKL